MGPLSAQVSYSPADAAVAPITAAMTTTKGPIFNEERRRFMHTYRFIRDFP